MDDDADGERNLLCGEEDDSTCRESAAYRWVDVCSKIADAVGDAAQVIEERKKLGCLRKEVVGFEHALRSEIIVGYDRGISFRKLAEWKMFAIEATNDLEEKMRT